MYMLVSIHPFATAANNVENSYSTMEPVCRTTRNTTWEENMQKKVRPIHTQSTSKKSHKHPFQP